MEGIPHWNWLKSIYLNFVLGRICSKALCANFIWKSKAHKMCWDDVCKSKNQGGLGIRKIKDIAKAVAVKLVWKFIQKESIWAKWMHSKYCNKINFWTAAMYNNASYTCKSLLKARQWCKGVIDRKIVTGKHTDIWSNSWMNGYSLGINMDRTLWLSLVETIERSLL